jgi:DNA polymerase-3 subunit delta
MPTQRFDAFLDTVRRGEIPGAIYLHGPEDVRKDEAIAEIVDRAIDPSLRDFNLDRRSATTLDPEAAETICNTLPLMAERRVVIIRDVEAWNKRAKAKATVLAYLERPALDTVLILVQGAGAEEVDPELAAKTVAVAALPLGPADAKRWVLEQAKRLQLPLEEAAAEHMVKVADSHLGILRSELDKLAGLATDRPLTLEAVAEHLGIRHGETQFDWRDAVLRGDAGPAVAMLPNLLAQTGISGVGLVSLLGTAVAGIGLARVYYDEGKRGPGLTQAVKGALFRARPPRLHYEAAAAQWSRLAPGWSRDRVEAALRSLLAADERLKNTTVADEAAILFDLVMELSVPWHVAA